MSKVRFGYDAHKDAWSWVVIAKGKDIWGLDWKRQNTHIPKELLSQILETDFPQAVKLAEKYISTNPKRAYRELIIREEINALKQSWKYVEKKYFYVLSNVTGKPIFSEQFGCFITTGFMCPYNDKENWFMASFWHSIPSSITTICHEIMHFQFLHYYKDYLNSKGLNSKQIDTLKEALTFLLNEPEFDEIILFEDVGYPEHQELRKMLKSIWAETKNFQELLDKAVLEMTASGGT